MLFSVIFIKEGEKIKKLYNLKRRIFISIMIRFNTVNNNAIIIYIKDTKNNKGRKSNRNPVNKRHSIYK